MADSKQRTINPLNALVGVDFKIFGTKLHAGYEKYGDDEYALLVIPTSLEADNGITVREMIGEIQELVHKADDQVNLKDMESNLQSGVAGLIPDGHHKDALDKIEIKLKMAFLYICKSEKETTIEYAFQLEVITEGMIPEKISKLVEVSNMSISVWNTQNRKLIDEMSLKTVNDYLGIAKQ